MSRSLYNTFGQSAADRRTIERADDAWVLAQRDSPAARFLPLLGTRCLVDDAAIVKLPRAALPENWQQWQSVFLGLVAGAPLFALAAPATAEDHFLEHGRFAELRAVALLLATADAALVAHARAVIHWHALNRYCGACGHEMRSTAGGHARGCTGADCVAPEIFPRIDPAVIVLVTDGERCLLGRQSGWPVGRWSCLAGFAEAGETLEETVRREVHEEAGIVIAGVEYHSSQPWPFPQSLMIGFYARAASRDIQLHDDELEDARWFSRADIRTELAAGTLRLSAPLSIAWRLVRDWYAEDGDPAVLDACATAP